MVAEFYVHYVCARERKKRRGNYYIIFCRASCDVDKCVRHKMNRSEVICKTNCDVLYEFYGFTVLRMIII